MVSADHVLAAAAAAGPVQRTPAPRVASPSAALYPVPVAGLAVGAVDDPAERAADARADQALARLRRFADDDTAVVPAGPLAADPLREVRRLPMPVAGARIGAAGGVLDRRTTARIDALRRTGSPLSGITLRRMENGFGTSLSQVRVHEGPESARLNADLSARAFTSGNDIFLGGSTTQPEGERVLAHEIAHVLDRGRAVAGASNADAPPVRRHPTLLEEKVGDADHTDSQYPGILLTKKGNSNVYTVCNAGASQGTLLYWDRDGEEWYRANPNGIGYSGDAIKLSELRDVAATDDVGVAVPTRVAVQTRYGEIGEEGWGVANVTVPTELHTSGLVSCVAWLLYSDTAAYLTHIVLGQPDQHVAKGLAQQVTALARQFEDSSGSEPQGLRMYASEESAYAGNEGRLWDWMYALVPKDVTLTAGVIEIVEGEFTHTVAPSDGEAARAEWRGERIKVQKKKSKKRRTKKVEEQLEPEGEERLDPESEEQPHSKTPKRKRRRRRKATEPEGQVVAPEGEVLEAEGQVLEAEDQVLEATPLKKKKRRRKRKAKSQATA